MPTVERLAKGGLRYNKFHTAALCSPTRAALLTGRNSTARNMGGVTETATAFPGKNGQRPKSVAPLAEMLRLNGYGTADVRQVARAAAVGGEPVRPDRPLAGALRVRQVLRVSSGRVQPVVPGPLRRHEPHPRSPKIRTTTS